MLIQDPHFYKVILFPPDRGLKIPDAFMGKYGRDLQDIVLLRVPTGASWQVELVHNGNGTLLQKGWDEFAKYYSVKKFYFLVFRYKGKSQFQVFIFDPTALEIQYPVVANCDWSDSCIRTSGERGSSCVRTELKISDDDEEISAETWKKKFRTTRASKGKRARVADTEEDVSIKFLDDLSECKAKNRSSHKLMIENPRKNAVKADTNPFYHPKSSGIGKAKQNEGNSGCSKQKMNKGNSPVGTRRPLKCSTSISNCKTVTYKVKLKSYEKARAFTSSNPFFISFMQPYYVSNCFYLEIPKKFSRSYQLSKKKRDLFMLHVSGSKISWPVTLSLRRSGIPDRGRFTTGWKKFVQDNGLRVGDLCVFELVPGTRNFNVTMYSSAGYEIVP